MKLDYATLLSFEPISFQNLGRVKSPKLSEISKLSFVLYNIYLSLLAMTPKVFCENVNKNKYEWYKNLQVEEKEELNIYDLIVEDDSLIEQYKEMFEWFFIEQVFYDKSSKLFYTYSDKNEQGEIIPIGVICRDNYNLVCDIILQCNGINNSENQEKEKVKNKTAMDILNKLKKGQEQLTKKEDKKMSLGNIISSVAAKNDCGLNIINIWDVTIFQLYDQFKKTQINISFGIQGMSLAAWGDKENKFNYDLWYENIYDK